MHFMHSNKSLNVSVLVYPDSFKQFVLTSYAFNTTIGHVLGQVIDDNRECVIAYGSTSFTLYKIN